MSSSASPFYFEFISKKNNSSISIFYSHHRKVILRTNHHQIHLYQNQLMKIFHRMIYFVHYENEFTQMLLSHLVVILVLVMHVRSRKTFPILIGSSSIVTAYSILYRTCNPVILLQTLLFLPVFTDIYFRSAFFICDSVMGTRSVIAELSNETKTSELTNLLQKC